MKSALPCILTINAGSSSIGFAVYEAGETMRLRRGGKIDRIGLSGTNLASERFARKAPNPATSHCQRPPHGVGISLDWFDSQPIFASLKAVDIVWCKA